MKKLLLAMPFKKKLRVMLIAVSSLALLLAGAFFLLLGSLWYRMESRRELATVLVPEDRAALRLAIYLGFHVRDQGLGSPARSRAERHALQFYLESAKDLRIAMGTGGAIAVGYHLEAA